MYPNIERVVNSARKTVSWNCPPNCFSDEPAARAATHATQTVCKRVAALEGGAVPAVPGATVPRGHVWLLGDNAENSTDSRVYGPVPYAMVKGRVFCRIFPFDQLALY